MLTKVLRRAPHRSFSREPQTAPSVIVWPIFIRGGKLKEFAGYVQYQLFSFDGEPTKGLSHDAHHFRAPVASEQGKLWRISTMARKIIKQARENILGHYEINASKLSTLSNTTLRELKCIPISQNLRLVARHDRDSRNVTGDRCNDPIFDSEIRLKADGIGLQHDNSLNASLITTLDSLPEIGAVGSGLYRDDHEVKGELTKELGPAMSAQVSAQQLNDLKNETPNAATTLADGNDLHSLSKNSVDSFSTGSCHVKPGFSVILETEQYVIYNPILPTSQEPRGLVEAELGVIQQWAHRQDFQKDEVYAFVIR